MNSRVLTTIALCSATLTLITTAAPAAAAVKSDINQSKVSRTNVAVTKPWIDMDLTKSTPTDATGNFKNIKVGGTPKVGQDKNLNGDVTLFDGHSGYLIPFSAADYHNFDNGVSVEAFFKYEGPTGGEHEIFSSQEGGGLGLGVENNMLKFFAHDGTGYKTPSTQLRYGKWIHAVGVIDTVNKKTKLYVDGKLVGTVDNGGKIKLPNGSVKSFVVGGDMKGSDVPQNPMTGKIKNARIYNKALSDAEINQLSTTARADIHEETPIEQTFNMQLVGSADVVAGHVYDLNVHTRQTDSSGDIDKLEYDVVFDANKFEYVGSEGFLQGDKTKVTQTDDHTVHISSTAKLTTAEVKQFGQTRVAQIQLKAKAINKATDKTSVTIKNATASVAGKAVDKVKMNTVVDQNITIQAKDTNDYNKDGIIGVGDIALAPDEKKAEVAQAAEIRPYKHVIVLTTDGGGNPWNPDGMYYTTSNSVLPKWTTDPEILKKRQNPYVMELFNKKFAMSTTAQAVKPSISAQNYSSMLHGLPWGDMDKAYQMNNGTAGQKYFEDFGKAQAKYPSVFKVLQNNNPKQNLAAFAEWNPIINGIIEPDAAADKHTSESWRSFDDVADYIADPKFNDTSLLYMQSDQMDHRGHSYGWYNDGYWNTYKKYDNLFKEVMDKLEQTGHIHDTLVIANADHGGSGNNHGSTDPSNMDTFIAMGGETIDSGRRLKGGSNADISALVLRALQVKQPTSMTAKVFDESAFLDQTALVNKKRQVEAITLERSTDKVTLNFKAQGDRQIRTADTRIDLAGRSIDKIDVPEGAKVLRQEVKDGQLKLTLSFNKQPGNTLANITLKSSKAKAETKVAIKEAMLGTIDGKEVLSDLINKDSQENNGDTKPTEPNKPGEDGNQVPKPTDPNKPGDNGGQKPKPNIPGNGNQTSGPNEGSAEKPKPVAPSKPGTGGSETPKPVVPSKPGTGSSETPKPVAPSKPDTGKPETPKPVVPSKPGDGDGQIIKPLLPLPSKPGTSNPETPKPVVPGKPGTGSSETPKPVAPSNPSTGNPETPKPVEPNQPNVNGSQASSSVKPGDLGHNQSTNSESNKVNDAHSGTEVVSAQDDTLKKRQHKKNKLKGKVVYAQRKIGFYKSTKFTKKNRYQFFTAKSESKWAQFKIIKKKGNRYQVKDINKGSKTYGKTGYITASRKYVTSAEYTKKAIKVKVIAPRGLSAYKNKKLTGKKTHYKKNVVLKVKKIVKVKGKYHFQLKNGKYITADKHMIHAYFSK